jgi:hypothetical protein
MGPPDMLDLLSGHLITLLAAIPIAYLLIPFLTSLLTPKPLPGIPYRKGRQYPIIGDGLDAGRWMAQQKTITQWVDGCAKACMYGVGEWGVLDGRKSAEEQLEELERKGLQRDDGYEGISQLVFGSANGAKHVIVTDVQGEE